MNSFISWIGGKRLLRERILEQFPEAGTYDRYIEVFGGAGWVLFSRGRHAAMEVYNDINGQLVNLFRIVKYHPEALQKELDWILMSREQFFDCRDDIRGTTDVQRAARFYVVVRESFGADCRSFRIEPRDMQQMIENLRMVSDRLRKVLIENVDFEHLIKTYDRSTALFYVDPPYYGAEDYYSAEFNAGSHRRLREALGRIQGRFVLSYNDCMEIRELYDGYTIIGVERRNNLAVKNGEPQRYKELIIKNFS
ncbi:DNA adenine methylase [Enterocloster lavalensis]|uniref:site-specific DNA-methyltransferase (adenine-specific) n=1 Tax=Enterocloster lavalensis TaxID=460384 RepID=A0A1I0K9V5_9FIRM|nr:DNA adenine methylase [Enterocloster lavalensis]